MTKKPQIHKFREKARELETDESADKFDAALRRLAGGKHDPNVTGELADMLGMADPNKDFGRKRRKD
jgi:hypothetical protein